MKNEVYITSEIETAHANPEDAINDLIALRDGDINHIFQIGDPDHQLLVSTDSVDTMLRILNEHGKLSVVGKLCGAISIKKVIIQ